jgi:predicted CopG family antitoxin
MKNKKTCGCSRSDMIDILMEFSNISREEAEKKIDESLKKKEAKQKYPGEHPWNL